MRSLILDCLQTTGALETQHEANIVESAQGTRARVRHPVPEPPHPVRASWRARQLKICGGHGLGETPGPIPNPEAKTQHGDGTALDRVWESSAPPQ